MVITPFLLLQNYLQDLIGKLSKISFVFIGKEIPFFLVLVAIMFIVVGFILAKNFTKKRLYGTLVVVSMFIIGYSTSDYYFGHHFYDIQHNWHYFSYAIYTWLVWRAFKEKGLSVEKIILRTFLLALSISIMDEVIQVFISNRIFDLSDVSKDLWGCMIGQVFIHSIIFDWKYIDISKVFPISRKNWSKEPSRLLIIEILFAWVFINVSAVLSDSEFVTQVVFFTVLFFFALVLLFQMLGKKKQRYIAIVIFGLLILYPIARISFTKPKVEYITENLIIYKGVPIAYFDVMVYPNGTFRPVDKKSSFNTRDKKKIEEFDMDILLLATGSKGDGGKGFNDQLNVELVYNSTTKKVYQIIKLPTKEACKMYNKLADEGKCVLMIIHNSQL
ncbi:MAG: hypothetical protein C0596_07560 [Marinilabiliales bacterium]|nr:MAG: hypothetical protein C0596_07560 [Marinilabiliales bacterium]